MRFKSACWIANRNSAEDLMISLRTFDLYHRLPCYVVCDSAVAAMLGQLKLSQCDVIPLVTMSEESSGIYSYGPNFKRLMMYKMDALETAIRAFGSAMYFDADMIFLGPLSDVDLERYEVVLSPHELKDNGCGIYNAGHVGASHVAFPDWWRKAAVSGKFLDQDCLNEAPKFWRTLELGMGYNFLGMKLDHAPTKQEMDRRYGAFSVGDTVYFDGKPLVSVHISAKSKEKLPPGQPVGGFFGMVIGFLEQSRHPTHRQVLEWVRP